MIQSANREELLGAGYRPDPRVFHTAENSDRKPIDQRDFVQGGREIPSNVSGFRRLNAVRSRTVIVTAAVGLI